MIEDTLTFSQVALDHLPKEEIQRVFLGHTSSMVYQNRMGFFIWREAPIPNCPVLRSILSELETDYVLFDRGIEPTEGMRTYH